MYELHIEPKYIKKPKFHSRFKKGQEPWNKGKKWTEYLDEDTMAAMRANLDKGRHLGKGHKNKSQMQPITAYMLDGSYLKTYESHTEAARCLEIERRNVSATVQGKRKQCGGYMFRPANIVTDQYGNKCVKKENIEPYTGRFINEY